MCRSSADGGRRCPTSRGGHPTSTQPSTSADAPAVTSATPRPRSPFEVDPDITVVTYRDHDGNLAKTSVRGAELAALRASGHLVEVHGSGQELLNPAATGGQPASDLPAGFRTVAPPAPTRLPTLPGAASLRDVPQPPAKPKRMSEKKYRELHDSSPCTVIRPDGTLYRCPGAASAHVVARSVPGSRVVEGHHRYH